MADTVFTPAPIPLAAVELDGASGGLLRFSTAGSVDDGKSTLIGRLLYDTQSAFEDQIESVRKSRVNRSSGPIDFSLLTDGLRAEREQGITIDVAYRYFSTPRRKFIIADTPGHVEYTRNMATGASMADAAIVLIDATRGVLAQSRRHAYIANLLGIRHLIFAVNKMDLVGYDQAVFRRTEAQVRELAGKLGMKDAYVVPVSALEGDNVVRPSRRMPWFEGLPLLAFLENLALAGVDGGAPFRLPVQYVIRPDRNFRGFAGQIASGTISAGDRVIALPSGRSSTVRSIVGFESERGQARAGDSITLTLEDEIDLSRGDLLAGENDLPNTARKFRANLVWMHPDPLDAKRLYRIKHTTHTARARVTRIVHRVDIETLSPAPAAALGLNEIASVEVESTLPLLFDPYRRNRTMGSFILIDPISNATVAAGMIEERIAAAQSEARSADEVRPVSAAERASRVGHRAAAIWIEGDDALAVRIERALFDDGWFVQLVRSAGFSPEELIAAARALRRAGVATVLSAPHGHPAKEALQHLFDQDAFFLNHPDAPNAFEAILGELHEWRASAGLEPESDNA